MEIRYLVEVENNEREHEIMNRFDEFFDNVAGFIYSLGIHPFNAWYLINPQIDTLISSLEGDVDILVGKLECADLNRFRAVLDEVNGRNPNFHPTINERQATNILALEGGLRWIPSLDYLVGIEVKCCYLPTNASAITEKTIKSKKQSKEKRGGIRKQINKLLKMGFNKVGLFDFIANPPADGDGSVPWFMASGIAKTSLKEMTDIFEKRLPVNSPVGHGACSISGVAGRIESGTGAYSNLIVRQAQNNPALADNDVKNNRREMEQKLACILQSLPHPRITPAIFICDRVTRQIRFANDGVIRA